MISIKEITQLVEMKQEGEYWDFKKEWYKNKSDLLHDIICMANNLTNHDGFIVIGIDEETDYSICDVTNDSNRRKTQDIVTFLRNKKFAGGIRPTVYVHSLYFGKSEIDILVIKNDRNTPYYLTENYQGVFANNIYARIMDTNTPKTSSADINIIERLWKKRFGIDATVFDRALLFLQTPNDWADSDAGKKFYKYAPEFTIEKISVEEYRNGYEFYLFNQNDYFPRWHDINIYYHQTLVYSLGGVALDGERCFTSTPRTEVMYLYKNKNHNWNVSYKYFVKDSIEYIVHLFYITEDIDDELIARQRFLECVLVFESEFERMNFNDFVKTNYEKYKANDFVDLLPSFPDLEGYDMEAFKKNYLQSQILQQILKDFRN